MYPPMCVPSIWGSVYLRLHAKLLMRSISLQLILMTGYKVWWNYWGSFRLTPHLRNEKRFRLFIYIYAYTYVYIYCTSCHIFLFDPMKIIVIHEQCNIRCRKLHATWQLLEAKTACSSLLQSMPIGTTLRRTVSSIATSQSIFRSVFVQELLLKDDT